MKLLVDCTIEVFCVTVNDLQRLHHAMSETTQMFSDELFQDRLLLLLT